MATVQEIKAWLKANRIQRKEFAERLGVAKGTVDIWLSGAREINDTKMRAIDIIMREGTNPTTSPARTISADDFRTFPVLMSAEDYALCEQAASASELSVSDWAAEILTAEAITFAQKEAAAGAKNSSATA